MLSDVSLREDNVISVLIARWFSNSQELEIRHAYKLCIHERDFVPGVGIADNIVECIGASKRIILVLSRHFLSSPWCQYEVQVALTELHQKRKSKLLIPILLEVWYNRQAIILLYCCIYTIFAGYRRKHGGKRENIFVADQSNKDSRWQKSLKLDSFLARPFRIHAWKWNRRRCCVKVTLLKSF